MTEIVIQATTRSCYCQGMNTTVGVECVGCHGTARLHSITYGIVPPLPYVSTSRWARFRRRVGLDHPLELQEWLRDLTQGFGDHNRQNIEDFEVLLYGEPGTGKTYAG